jgi:hypothetical protein
MLGRVCLIRLSAVLAVASVVAFVVNYLGAAGGHCDDSCSGDFPFWLFVASGWVVTLCVASLGVIGVVALIRRLKR